MARMTFSRWLPMLGLLPALLASGAHGQTAVWPSKPVRIVVTFPPGGAPDTLARILADKWASLGQTVTVDNAASCTATPYTGETLSFSNSPLTDITVTVNSQVDGGTSSTIECGFVAANPDTTISAASPANGDGSLSKTGLVPGTYTCTIVVDP